METCIVLALNWEVFTGVIALITSLIGFASLVMMLNKASKNHARENQKIVDTMTIHDGAINSIKTEKLKAVNEKIERVEREYREGDNEIYDVMEQKFDKIGDKIDFKLDKVGSKQDEILNQQYRINEKLTVVCTQFQDHIDNTKNGNSSKEKSG